MSEKQSDTTDGAPDEAAEEWPIIEGREVKEERYIQCPKSVQTAVEKERIDGPSVFWSYDRNSHWVVLSKNPLSRESYLGSEYTQIQDPDEPYSRIRPPKSLGDQIISKFFPGNNMFYLARDEMLSDSNPTVYLLQAAEVATLLPSSVEDLDTDEAKQRILNNPGFLSSL